MFPRQWAQTMRKVRAVPVDIITAQFTKQSLYQISCVISCVIIFFLLTLFSDPYSKDDKCLWDPKKVSVTECKYDMFCIYVHSCIRFYELCCFCLCTIINFSYVFLFSIKLWMIYIALHVYNVVGKVCKSCFFFWCINQPFE